MVGCRTRCGPASLARLGAARFRWVVSGVACPVHLRGTAKCRARPPGIKSPAAAHFGSSHRTYIRRNHAYSHDCRPCRIGRPTRRCVRRQPSAPWLLLAARAVESQMPLVGRQLAGHLARSQRPDVMGRDRSRSTSSSAASTAVANYSVSRPDTPGPTTFAGRPRMRSRSDEGRRCGCSHRAADDRCRTPR